MAHTQIKFGTSGWRAILSDEFTFENVRRVLNAIILYLRSMNLDDRPVIVGSDTRFLSDTLRNLAAEHLAKHGIPVLCTDRDCPTPVISFYIRKKGLAGGINFTASHNPAEYQGIKFSPANGAPAPPEITQAIETLIDAPVNPAQAPAAIETVDPSEEYFEELKKFLDFKVIRSAGLRVACDVLYGAGRGYLDELMMRAGSDVTTLHNYINPSFGGRRPEPAPENLEEMTAAIRENGLDLGLSTDGDADRFGIIDCDGTYYNPNQVLCLLSWHLLKNRKCTGRIVRTVATTGYLDRIAAHFDTEIVEVPVGFKFIGPLIIEGGILLGGEESGGLSVGGHVPEKDGILACGLVAELVATEKKSLGETWKDIESVIGPVWTDRVDLTLTDAKKEHVLSTLADTSKEEFIGRAVTRFNGTDGYKFAFGPSEWVLVRPSGTEPIVRCYIESDTAENGEALKQSLVGWLQEC
jgi:phosphoglucomutase